MHAPMTTHSGHGTPCVGISGMPNIRDHDMSVYLKVQGTALQVGGYEPNPILEKVHACFYLAVHSLCQGA